MISSSDVQPLERDMMVKAFVVWVCFSCAGWIAIPPQLLPLFSHSVGFAFYLIIVTRQTRWVPLVFAGAVAFLGLIYMTVPSNWMQMTVNITGSTLFFGFLIFAVFAKLMYEDPLRVREQLFQQRAEWTVNMRSEYGGVPSSASK